jgi:hypothetical protein
VPIVSYTHQLNYLYGPDQRPFPGLVLQLLGLGHPQQALETDAYLDSGAERSLFDGWIATALGVDLLSGRRILYRSTAGREVEGRLHQVELSHPDLGTFQLEVGFSTEPIRRNLLGRDFFNLIQIGFRERHFVFYVTPTP